MERPSRYRPRTYQTSLNISIPIVGSQHRDSHDRLRTGVTSNVFLGETDCRPRRRAASAAWCSAIERQRRLGQRRIFDAGRRLGSDRYEPMCRSTCRGFIEPDDATQGQVLNNISPGARPSAGRLEYPIPRRRVRPLGEHARPRRACAFSSKTRSSARRPSSGTNRNNCGLISRHKASTVSLQAYATGGAASYGRLEAYNSANQLIARFTTVSSPAAAPP